MSDVQEQLTNICDRTKHELLALICSLAGPKVEAAPLAAEWMTEEELARYWRILKDGEPVTAGIHAWANRPPDEFPLPCARMGEMRRYHRETADRWAWEEAERQRAKRAQRKLREVKRA